MVDLYECYETAKTNTQKAIFVCVSVQTHTGKADFLCVLFEKLGLLT